jgi:glucoamylase
MNAFFRLQNLTRSRFSFHSLIPLPFPFIDFPFSLSYLQSKNNPDYFYHWVRDAALVIDTVRKLWERTNDNKYRDIILDYIAHEKRIQERNDAQGGLGEPKYYMDGRPYDGPWGRPQNDGEQLENFGNWGALLSCLGQVQALTELLSLLFSISDLAEPNHPIV